VRNACLATGQLGVALQLVSKKSLIGFLRIVEHDDARTASRKNAADRRG
jgi:hypothetical protein